MARTDATKVAAIIEVEEDIDLTPFIDVASQLVVEICEPVTTYTEERLTTIETWLAAHFYAVRMPRSVTSTVGPIMDRFESEVDLGLSITRYGQQAMLLDTAGGLAALDAATKKGGRRRPRLYWGGTDEDS